MEEKHCNYFRVWGSGLKVHIGSFCGCLLYRVEALYAIVILKTVGIIHFWASGPLLWAGIPNDPLGE